MIRLRQSDPEAFNLRLRDLQLARTAFALARDYRRAADDEPAIREVLEARMQDALAERFEVRQAIRRRELTALESRLTDFRERLDADRQNRDQILEDQLARLTRATATSTEDRKPPATRPGNP